jgi:hypothetical protein
MGGRIEFMQTLDNKGQINLLGADSVLTAASLVNSGFFAGRGTVRTTTGLTNTGEMAFTGTADIAGPVDNQATTSVLGGTATFFGPVAHSGLMHVATGSTGIFLQGISGSGSFSGGGTKIFRGSSSSLAAMYTPGDSVVEAPAQLAAQAIRENSLAVTGVVLLSGPQPSMLQELSIAPGGLVELTGGDLVLADPLGGGYETVRQWILWPSGGLKPGPSLIHPLALAPVDNRLLHIVQWEGLDISDGTDFGQVIVKYTYLGDCNLDGQVNEADFVNLLAHMGSPGAWFEGDVNLDGLVNFADFQIVSAHLGAGGGSPLASQYVVVPEPTPMALLLLPALALLVRRPRRGVSPS